EQRVIFNVEIYVPLELNTPKQDRLEEVLDYDFIRKTIVERVKRGHIHLQETLCDEIVAAILEHPNVMAVRVSTAKPDVYPDCKTVGIESMRFAKAP
ncbi:MAG: dihydroneopterin aldolase, partial [Betaproteobacteria bacterium]|nr:dihydroneopterin aldolase [Betaproteobacteria bacterium]